MNALRSALKRKRPGRPLQSGRPARPGNGVLRRLAYFVLCCAIGFEALVLVLVFMAPDVLAFFGGSGVVIVSSAPTVETAIGGVNTTLGYTNNWLSEIKSELETHTGKWETALSKHEGGWLASNLEPVTQHPAGALEGFPYPVAETAGRLGEAMPGFVAWGYDADGNRVNENYYQQYGAGAQNTMLTLRTSMTGLQRHYEDAIKVEADRLEEVRSSAKGADGLLEIGQVQTEAMLEVSRQLQAMRELLATQANLYAVAESYHIGTEARTVATSQKARCEEGVRLGLGVGTDVLDTIGGWFGADINPCG